MAEEHWTRGWQTVAHHEPRNEELVERLGDALDRIQLNASLLADALGISDFEVARAWRSLPGVEEMPRDADRRALLRLGEALTDARWSTRQIRTELAQDAID